VLFSNINYADFSKKGTLGNFSYFSTKKQEKEGIRLRTWQTHRFLLLLKTSFTYI
jgi:hypothetical protein